MAQSKQTQGAIDFSYQFGGLAELEEREAGNGLRLCQLASGAQQHSRIDFKKVLILFPKSLLSIMFAACVGTVIFLTGVFVWAGDSVIQSSRNIFS